MSTAATVALALLLRRHAPRGGFLTDTNRVAAIFSGISTLFSVLLALVILLSVENYSEAESRANAEADSVLEQFQLAALFPSRHQYAIQSQLVCYGRSVASLEWPRMNLESNVIVDNWADSIDAVTDTVTINGPRAESGFELFLQQSLERQQERRGRLEGAEGALPGMVWPILILGAVGIIAYLIAFADRGESALSQVFQVGLVTLLLGSSLLLINALNHPFAATPGKIVPDEIQRSVAVMEAHLRHSIDSDRLDTTLPCDDEGSPREDLPVARTFPPGSTMAEIVERGKLVVGVSYNIALFGELDPLSGAVSGFDNDFAMEIAREMGLRRDQIEFVDMIPSERLGALQRREVDLVVMALTITPQRAELVDFSKPYYMAGQTILVPRQSRSISGLRDLADRDVCVIDSSTAVATIEDRAPDANLVLGASPGDCLGKLLANEVEAIALDDIILAGFAAENPELMLVGGTFTDEPYGVGVPKGHGDMVEFVNGVIDAMLEDGRWGRIYYEYLADIAGLPNVPDAKQRLLQ